MRARTLNFIFVLIVILAIALTLGSGLLLKAALCMAIMLVLSLLSVCLAYFTAGLDMPNRRITIRRGQKTESEISLSYFSLIPLGSVAFVTDAGRTLRFGSAPIGSYTKKLFIDAPHVGVFTWGGGRLYLTDVFNLFVFSKEFKADNAIMTVLPRTFETEKPENRSGESGEGEVRLSDDSDEPSGIRDWTDGDLLKRVHWKLSQKNYDIVNQSIKPLVKTYEEAARPDILVLPDLSGLDLYGENALNLRDAVCEGALSLCKAITDASETVRLVLCQNETREVVSSGEEGLTEAALALANAENETFVSFENLVSEAMRRVGTTSTVVFVTAGLDERSAEVLTRLRSYSGMNVAVMYVNDSHSRYTDLLQAKLEANGITVKRAAAGKEANDGLS